MDARSSATSEVPEGSGRNVPGDSGETGVFDLGDWGIFGQTSWGAAEWGLDGGAARVGAAEGKIEAI